MMPVLLPLMSLAMASSTAGSTVETVSAPGTAQVRLAEVLASADAIESITANDRTITFALDRSGEAMQIIATVGSHGSVRSLSISDLGPAASASGERHGRGPLGWLATAVSDASAVTDLSIDGDGRVRLTADHDRVYLLIPGHAASATNMSVEARWAAAWDDAS